MAQRFLHSVFSAFARSPQWHRGLFVLTYDEWGGFFDHVAPPVVPDDRASKVDLENFGQTGFRVPTVLASPFAAARVRRLDAVRPHVDPALPRVALPRCTARGRRRGRTGRWYLTKRDRAAHNLGSSLVTTADPELDFDLDGPIPIPSDGCRVAEGPAVANELGPSDVQPSDRFNDLVTTQFLPAIERPWQPA